MSAWQEVLAKVWSALRMPHSGLRSGIQAVITGYAQRTVRGPDMQESTGEIEVLAGSRISLICSPRSSTGCCWHCFHSHCQAELAVCVAPHYVDQHNLRTCALSRAEPHGHE